LAGSASSGNFATAWRTRSAASRPTRNARGTGDRTSENTRGMFGHVVGELPGAHSRLRAAFIIRLLFMGWTRMGAVWRRDHNAASRSSPCSAPLQRWVAWTLPRTRSASGGRPGIRLVRAMSSTLGHRGRAQQNPHNPTFLSQAQLIRILATHGVPRPGARSSEACPTGVGGRDRPTAGTDFQIRRCPGAVADPPARRAKGTPSGAGPGRPRGSAGGTVLRQWTVVSPAGDAHDSGRGPGR